MTDDKMRRKLEQLSLSLTAGALRDSLTKPVEDLPFTEVALASSRAALELASRPPGAAQPLDFFAPRRRLVGHERVRWTCECGETHRIRRIDPGILLACDRCGRLVMLEARSVRRVAVTSGDPEALGDILVVYTHTRVRLRLSDLLAVLDRAGGRIAVETTPGAPADLAPLLQMFEGGPFREVDHISWFDTDLNEAKLLTVLPSNFELACENFGHSVWASDPDQALIQVLEDYRMDLVNLAIYDDRPSYRSAFADALDECESDECESDESD